MRHVARRTASARPARAALIAAGLLTAGVLTEACGLRGRLHRSSPPPPPDPVVVEWAATLDRARAALGDGRYAAADSTLTAFRERYAANPQSADALYWRALARLSLAAPASGTRDAVADLDAYRATAAPEHYAEAVALRRALVRLDSARVAAGAAAVAAVVERPAVASRAGLVPRDSLRARDEEIQRVRAEAAAAQVELERLRRRLAAPGRRP